MMDSQNLMRYIESLKLYRQSKVIRWQLRDFVFSENDSEHQLYVSQIIVILSTILKVPDKDALLALKYGCVHDYVESCSGIGDVNYKLKQDNSLLKQVVKELENVAMQSAPEFYQAMQDCETSKISRKLVELADAIDAALYVRREIAHNKNADEWLKLYKSTEPRVDELYTEFIQMLKENE